MTMTFADRMLAVMEEVGATTMVDSDLRWVASEIVSVRGEIDGYSWTDAPENARRARIREATLMSIAKRLAAAPPAA